MLTEQRKKELIELCQELLRQQSYSGEEGKVVKSISEAFQKMGFDDYFVDSYGNVIGHIKGNKPGKTILFDGHIDTVPVPDDSKWLHAPFGGELVDGKIYGRGASDMKGAVSAMIAAAAYFAEDSQRDFAGDIYVAGVVHEEIFEGIAARKISEAVQPDYVVIGEASELNLKRGQRGRAEIVVETFGKPAHSANPEKGINAVLKMSKLIDRIQGLDTPEQEVLGKGILVLTDIKSSPYPGASVVPDHCRATYDRRLLVGETPESVLAPIKALIAEMEKQDPEFKARASFAVGTERCYTGEIIEGERFFPGWLYDEQDELVQAALKGLREVGLNPEVTHYSFCTNGSHYAGEKGIKTIGFGPSRENLAHTIDEYIEVDQLCKGAAGYYAIIKSVLKKR
ncbi:YgeY family selenium metabolism-linked hydrolase [Desulforamulus aeronauticus]|uniref:Putative selenium metabolism hydrolase n=1 Tax=Desulforamulus aeronauticus DSM 10349 TaxID=1121421 RepID=A0A1M6P0D6_9FIRM|nr:YgeY family selenium metabolism-linked hydrolase [Desulforamulus aeronauticus]SHK01374.1 putative selenium metabolism hydrolase [Desulforamulus aeronauticus DSM 10349]